MARVTGKTGPKAKTAKPGADRAQHGAGDLLAEVRA